MKKILRRLTAALALCLIFAFSLPAFAQAADYTYTVTLSMGRLGTVRSAANGEGVNVSDAAATITSTAEKITITNLHYGAQVTLNAQHAAKVTQDDRYYIQGIRLSGRDNKNDDGQSTGATDPNFFVTGDADYVVAYGIPSDLVAYTVRYVDADGNPLHAEETYYGNVGDTPVVAYLYIEGYTPAVYSISATLTSDPGQNIFTFVYNRVDNDNDDDNDGDDTTPTPTPTPGEIVIEIPTGGPTGGGNGGSGGGDRDDDDDDTQETTEPEEVVVEVPADDSTNGGAGDNGGAAGGDGALSDGEDEGAEEEHIGENDTPLGRLMEQIKKVAETVANASPVTKVVLAVGLAAAVGLLIFLLLLLLRRKNDDEEENEE